MEEEKKRQNDQRTTEKERDEDYEDPICVCEAEPRWEELGRELEEKEGK